MSTIDTTEVADIYSRLEKLATRTLNKQAEEHNLTETQVAEVLASTIQTLITTSASLPIQYMLNEAQVEVANKDIELKNYELNNLAPANLSKINNEADFINTQESELSLNGTSRRNLEASQKAKIDKEKDIAGVAYDVAYATKQDKIDSSGYNKLKTQAEQQVATGSINSKILQSQYTADNVNAQAELTEERKTQLIASVIFNNYKNALSDYGETLGMHKNGGGTITEAMWLPALELTKALALSDTNYAFTFGTVSTDYSE